ncbi:MAG: monofunctional biosynthetic peptidoglycan transglycosylase, partial [bacterium]
LRGPFAVEIRGLRLRWRGRGPGRSVLTLPSMRVRFQRSAALGLRLRIASVRAHGGRLLWQRRGAFASLGRLVRRTIRRRPGGRRQEARAGGKSPERTAVDIRMASIDVQELTRSESMYGLSRFRSRGLSLWRRSSGRWGADAQQLRASAWQGPFARMTGLRWRGRDRQGGGLRTSLVRVGTGEVGMEGNRASRQLFSLEGDEVAPDLLQLRLLSPPHRGAGGRRIDAETQGLTVRGVMDGLKRTARGEAGGVLGLHHLMRITRPAGVDVTRAALRGVVRGELDPSRATLTSDVALSDVRIQRRLLAPHAVTWPRLRVRATARYLLRERRLEVEGGEVRIGQVPLLVSGRLTHRRGAFNIGVTVTLPPTPCAQLLETVPGELVPKLRGMKLAGRLGGHAELTLDTRRIRDVGLELEVKPNRCRVLRDPPGAQVAALKRPFTFVTRPPGWKPTRLRMGPQNPNWRAYPNLGRHVVAAFLAAEDQRFFKHRGFDLENIRRALADNLDRHVLIKGASSISQQVVKNVFLSHRRDLSRKLEEVVLTWRLEQVLSKQRILEIYLNLVEMGPGIFGAPAAAKHYFHREPSHLSPLQAVHLAAITPSPRRYYEQFRSGRAGMEWLLHLRYLLFQMLKIGWIDRATHEKYRHQDLRLLTY